MKSVLERLAGEKGYWWYGFCTFLSITFFVLFYRLRTFDREKVPLRGAVMIASNHQSFFDPVVLSLGLSRQTVIMAREGLFRIPVLNALIRSLNAFPIRRGEFDREAIRTALDVLRRGEVLLLFPEGTRTRDGRLGRAKAGIGFLARKAGVPVVPAVIHGAWRAWPAGRAWFRLFVPIRVAYGEPLDPEAYGKAGLEAEIDRSWAGLMERLERMA